jgi:hypothetical protein
MHRRLAPLTIATLAALLGGCAREAPPPAVPDTVDRFGALELITHTRAYRIGQQQRIRPHARLVAALAGAAAGHPDTWRHVR